MNDNDVEFRVLDVVRQFLGASATLPAGTDLDAQTPLLDSGVLDSLGILQLTTRIEQVFGIEVTDEDFVPENFATVGSLARYVGTRLAAV